MKVGDDLCRGSMIRHHGKCFVVLGDSKSMLNASTSAWGYYWRTLHVTDAMIASGTYRIAGATLFAASDEVDMVFPGVAIALPECIK